MAVAYTPAGKTYPIHAQSGYVDGMVDITFSGSYATGGDSFDLGAFIKRGGGPGTVSRVDFDPVGGYNIRYDRVNKKIMVYSTAGTEHAAAAYNAALTAAPVRAYVRGL